MDRDRKEQTDRLYLITQRIGYALWQLQELEGIAAEYFVLVAQAKKGMGLEAGNALVNDAKRKTFGTTIKNMKNNGLLDKALSKRLEKILSERNWLVHRSREEHKSSVFNDQGMRIIINRVNWVADEAFFLLKEIGLLAEKHMVENGVSKAYIDKQAKELLEAWHKAEQF